MTEALYLSDSYLASCGSKVLQILDNKFAILDRTVFYPVGGGQPSDTGLFIRKSDGAAFEVINVTKSSQAILHEFRPKDPNAFLSVGDEIECKINWERRYRLMRMHTAGHILSAILFRKNILITGNQLGVDKSRFDFSLENFDREEFQKLVDEANREIAKNLEVSTFYLSRQEALNYPGAVKLASALPPDVLQLRMIRIGDIDCQADGGTHVKNTSEIGKIIFLSAENKGKSNRRIYYTLNP
ncbi:MAG: alanyl-tRNA editing protein [Candidatus Micrarchaeota archaeon]|nr:alanyl-tRNA editing protein [Candidatus Micrarchaeota archaeon]